MQSGPERKSILQQILDERLFWLFSYTSLGRESQDSSQLLKPQSQIGYNFIWDFFQTLNFITLGVYQVFVKNIFSLQVEGKAISGYLGHEKPKKHKMNMILVQMLLRRQKHLEKVCSFLSFCRWYRAIL